MDEASQPPPSPMLDALFGTSNIFPFENCKGQSVDQNYERAAEYYEAAARQGMAIAQNNLGILYANGQGVDQSYERAAEHYEAAARQGTADAQCSLGVLYYNGQGVKQSFGTAREWWMKSAEQGHEGAIKNLQIIDEHKGRATPSFTPPKQCSTCDAPETPSHKLNMCTCFGVQYCKNSTCQKSHWKIHQKEHRRLCKATNLKNTEGEMKDEEEEIEKKETATADSQQQEEEEEDICHLPCKPATVVIENCTRHMLWKGNAYQVSRRSRQTKEPVHYVPYSEPNIGGGGHRTAASMG
jgi:TPR repeat protein